mgnify:CR=1 FL=1
MVVGDGHVAALRVGPHGVGVRARQVDAGEALAAIVDEVPDAWLDDPERLRAAYADFLTARLGTRGWLPARGAA